MWEVCVSVPTLSERSAIRWEAPVSAVALSGLFFVHHTQKRSPKAGLCVKPEKQHYTQDGKTLKNL